MKKLPIALASMFIAASLAGTAFKATPAHAFTAAEKTAIPQSLIHRATSHENCQESAYRTCKNRECDKSSEYCTGDPADIRRSPCYEFTLAECIKNTQE